MQKTLERYEMKCNDMQKQIDSLTLSIDTQRDQNDRLNIELTDLTDLHQIEMSSVKTDLKNLEERLLYKFNDYWNELLEKLDKLDTRVSFRIYSMLDITVIQCCSKDKYIYSPKGNHQRPTPVIALSGMMLISISDSLHIRMSFVYLDFYE